MCVSDATKHRCGVQGGLHGTLDKAWVEVDTIFVDKWTIAHFRRKLLRATYDSTCNVGARGIIRETTVR